MISVEKLSRKPALFISFTGMSITEFQKLAELMRESEAEYEENRLSRPNRKRAIGGGRKLASD